MKKASAKVVLRKQRPLNDGRYPLKLRVTYNRKSQYYSLPLSINELLAVTEEEWKNINSSHTKKSLKEAKQKINGYELKADDILKNWNWNKNPFTFENFKVEFFNNRSDITLFDIFKEVIDELKKEHRIGTANSYEDAKTSFQKFVKGRSYSPEDIDEPFLRKYETWMRANDKSVSTVGIYLRSLKRILNTAIAKGYLDKNIYPFNQYKIPTAKTKKRALLKANVQKLFKYKTIKKSSMWKAQQYFMFSYLCQGMNFTDIAYLKQRDLVLDRINYIRKKTQHVVNETKTISIKITPQIQKIINSLRLNDSDPNSFVFPILHADITADEEKQCIKQFIRNTNKWLKRIAKEIDIDPNITTYYARHSYATILKRSGLPISLIQEGLNHKRITTTEAYLDSFDNEELDKANENLL